MSGLTESKWFSRREKYQVAMKVRSIFLLKIKYRGGVLVKSEMRA